MKRHFTGDLWADAKLLQADERMTLARARAAARVLLRHSRPPPRSARVQLGSLLVAAGHRLLGSAPTSSGPASPMVLLRDGGEHHEQPI